MAERRVVDAKQFAKSAKDEGWDKAGVPKDILVRTSMAATVTKAEDEPPPAAQGEPVESPSGDRTLQFTISTADVDRMGDTIDADGWRLDAYRQNAVVLFAHSYSMVPVAKAPRVWVEAGALKALAEFQPADRPVIGPLAECLLQSYRDKFMSAVSVGFKPIKWRWVDDDDRPYGIEFEEQELLEFSCVPVPANPNALIEMAAKGIDAAPLVDWAEGVLLKALKATDERSLLLARKLTGAKADDVVLSKAAHDALVGKASRLDASGLDDGGHVLLSKADHDALQAQAAAAKSQPAATPRLVRALTELARVKHG